MAFHANILAQRVSICITPYKNKAFYGLVFISTER
jgi:hypothetical protein